MKNQTFKDWLYWGIPCTFLVGIFGSYHYIHEGVYSSVDAVVRDIVPHILQRYESVLILNALTGEVLYDSDELPF